MSVLFIADLHLHDKQPEIYRRFANFLKTKARNARALYILGDLFEYYLGDDVKQGVIAQVAQDIDDLVKKYNTRCYFMPGNRDFLLAENFSNQLTLIPDATVIKLDDKRLILSHADNLCTDDKTYQKIRKQLRDPQWQKWFLSQTIEERMTFAENARKQSQEHTKSSNSEIMDVNQQTVNLLFKQYKATYLLHGHTHRPAFHQFEYGDSSYLRMVLGDWHYQSSYIEYINNSFKQVLC